MPLIPANRNRLAYPAGVAPGIDGGHVALAGLATNDAASTVHTGSSFTSLQRGTLFTKIGTNGSSLIAGVGPSLLCNTGNYGTLAGQPTAATANVTYAAIVQFTAVSGTQGIAGHSSAQLFCVNSAVLAMYVPAAFRSSAITLAANTPYFLIGSAKSNVAVNFLALNMATGAVKTETVAIAVGVTAPGNTLHVGTNQYSTSQVANGYISAAMYAPSFLSISELMAWGADPWSFWYPSVKQRSYAIASASVGFPWWAVRNNNFVIGTGVQ